MNCHRTTDEELIALTTGELSVWHAWRLRQHLAHCVDCHAAFAAVQTLWRAVHIAREETVAEDIKERLYASMLFTWRPESNARSEPINRAMLYRTKRATLATSLLTALVLMTPVVASVVYVRYSHEEAERRKIGADWQQRNWMTQQNYVRLRQIIDSARKTRTVSDKDIDWSLGIMKRSHNAVVHARVLGMFTLLKKIPLAQKKKLQAAIDPFLTSEDKLDRAYAIRVQTVLDKH